MADNQKQTNECKCLGDKKAKALEKEIAELRTELEEIRKELTILRRAVRK